MAYTVTTDDGKISTVYDGKEIGKEYISVGVPVNVDGKLAYTARNGREYFIIYDGKKISHENVYSLDNLTNVGGKLAYIVQKVQIGAKAYDFKTYVIYDGEEIGKEYDMVRNVMSVNNKLAYVAIKDKKQFIIYDGKKIGSEYDSVGGLISVGGKLAYTVAANKKKFVVYDGKEIGKEYDSAGGFFSIDQKLTRGFANVNGKLAFTATKNGRDIIVMEK